MAFSAKSMASMPLVSARRTQVSTCTVFALGNVDYTVPCAQHIQHTIQNPGGEVYHNSILLGGGSPSHYHPFLGGGIIYYNTVRFDCQHQTRQDLPYPEKFPKNVTALTWMTYIGQVLPSPVVKRKRTNNSDLCVRERVVVGGLSCGR